MNPSWAPAHVQASGASRDFYTDEDLAPKDSPMLTARTAVDIRPSPPSSLELEAPEESPHSSSRGGRNKQRSKHRPNPGDAVLVAFLVTDGRHQETVNLAGTRALPSDTSEDPDQPEDDEDDPKDASGLSPIGRNGDRGYGSRLSEAALGQPGHRMSLDDPPPAPGPAGPLGDLQSLAAGAMAAIGGFGGHRDGISESASRTPTNLDVQSLQRDTANVTERGARRDGPAPPRDLERDRERERDEDRERDDRNSIPSAASPYSPQSTSAYSHSPLQPPSLSPRHHQVGLRSPTTAPRNPELPPIQGIVSPMSEVNGSHNPLPSFRDAFSDLGLGESQNARRTSAASYGPHSPPGSMPRLASLSVASPPVSPNDFRRGDIPSPAPHMSAATSPYYSHHPGANGYPRHSADYSSSSATETPGSTGDYAHTPAGSDGRLVAEGGLQSAVGHFVCKFPGCNSVPFHTQYLLNSHMNVHSSARPHYCPVKGCPRSEGGKGFKRKNEMIRHGLVHDSPGYICPFCPDREHKYPRPDNLQRHVRVHHVDKDKDEPLLRDVLAQRPDGPNRGRRRRHGPG